MNVLFTRAEEIQEVHPRVFAVLAGQDCGSVAFTLYGSRREDLDLDVYQLE